MTRDIYLRRALLAPLLAPLPLLVLGSLLPGGFAGFALLALGSLLYGGVPYLLFASVVAGISRHWPAERLVRWARVAPLLFAPWAGLGMAAFFAVQPGAESRRWAYLGGLFLEGAALAVVVGYLYVAAVLAGDHVRRSTPYTPAAIAAARAREAASPAEGARDGAT